MKAREKYTQVFGKIDSLAERVPWSTGLSNMLEWLLWSTSDVLGVSKKKLQKKVIEWSLDESLIDASIEEKIQFVQKKVELEIKISESLIRYERPKSSLASPREALRRAKYFSEDYLNKEFDIFWSLVSDKYLDSFYSQFITLQGGSSWYTHGNSGLFAYSVGINEMQMDNLSYNPGENLLVANELKLGGKKNPDQILKYSLMYRLLLERGFIAQKTRFMLLFIGDKLESENWDETIEAEIEYCKKSTKSTAKKALNEEGVRLTKKSVYKSITWNQLVQFNEEYINYLEVPLQQVEEKVLQGFNDSLLSKAFMT